MTRRWARGLAISTALLAGIAAIVASIVIPVVLLHNVDDKTLNRWAQIGEALTPIGVFFSGVAFIAIALTLLFQGRQLRNQGEELAIATEGHRRGSEIALRQLHNDLIKMAIEDRDLREVWPPIAPGVPETKKDHYCNLILNLQKVAHETHTIELEELRSALSYLFSSRDMYSFWSKARAARVAVTGGDDAEDIFTAEVDRAFEEARPLPPRTIAAVLRDAVREWVIERGRRTGSARR